MKITVLGCGRWAGFLAWYCSSVLNHDVLIWGRDGSHRFESVKNTRRNEFLTLPKNVCFSSNLENALAFGEVILISISSQSLRELAKEISKYEAAATAKIFILCMKGLEVGSGKRLTMVLKEEIKFPCKPSILVGPGHAQDLVNNKPTSMLVGSDDINTTHEVVAILRSNLIRLYMGQDLIGNEIGAASKNVIGIAAGMLDALDLSSLKGVLMARGAREISRLVKHSGGNELTVYGLSHLGDYQATLFSEYSHNRLYGQYFIQKNNINFLAEGVETSKALILLAHAHKVELPICNAVSNIIFKNAPPKLQLEELFSRDTKFEFM